MDNQKEQSKHLCSISYTIHIMPWSEFQKETIEWFMGTALQAMAMSFEEHHKKTKVTITKDEQFFYPYTCSNGLS